MAIAPKTDVPETVAREALNTGSNTATASPEVRPNLSGYSKEDLAGMLKADEGRRSTSETVMPKENQPILPAEETKQPGPPPPQEAPVPDKFKNPDGSLNTDNLLKSYLETEKTMSRQNQSLRDVDLMRSENQELREQLQGLMEFKSSLESQMAEQQEQAKQQPLTQEQLNEMTPDQQQEYFREAARSEIRAEVQKMEAQRDMDLKIKTSIDEVTKLEGYEHLKDDINNILKSDIFDYNPDAPRVAYYAALGHKTPELITQAKNIGYSEGYAKAKEEMGKQVDSGKASAPVSIGGMSEDQLRKLSKEDLARLLPKYNNDTYTLY